MASIKRDGGRPFDAPILRDTTICPKHILWNNGSSTCTFENCFLRTKHKQFDSSVSVFNTLTTCRKILFYVDYTLNFLRALMNETKSVI
jgi:hypothetical protein